MFKKIRKNISLFIYPENGYDKVEEKEPVKNIRPNVYDFNYHNTPERPEDGMTNQEVKEFQVWAKNNSLNPYFKRFIDWGVNCRIKWLIEDAKNERAIDFVRSNIEDFQLLESEVERLANLFDAEQDKINGNSFDEYSTGIREVEE